MIIFSDNPGFIPIVQSKFNKTPIKVYNLSSLYSGYESITCLMTNMKQLLMPGGITINDYVYTPQFDVAYANLIMSTDIMFEAFMKIMVPVDQGSIVFILVHRDDYRDAVMESIIKFIQERYGYHSWIMEDIDDVECIKEGSFSPYGLINLDEDKRHYDSLFVAGRVHAELYDINLKVEV